MLFPLVLRGIVEGGGPLALSGINGWCVYVLKCRDDFLYIGLTNNIGKRMSDHARGYGSKFVRSRRPFELMKVIACGSAGEARRLEYRLKRLRRSRKIETLGLTL